MPTKSKTKRSTPKKTKASPKFGKHVKAVLKRQAAWLGKKPAAVAKAKVQAKRKRVAKLINTLQDRKLDQLAKARAEAFAKRSARAVKAAETRKANRQRRNAEFQQQFRAGLAAQAPASKLLDCYDSGGDYKAPNRLGMGESAPLVIGVEIIGGMVSRLVTNDASLIARLPSIVVIDDDRVIDDGLFSFSARKVAVYSSILAPSDELLSLNRRFIEDKPDFPIEQAEGSVREAVHREDGERDAVQQTIDPQGSYKSQGKTAEEALAEPTAADRYKAVSDALNQHAPIAVKVMPMPQPIAADLDRMSAAAQVEQPGDETTG